MRREKPHRRLFSIPKTLVGFGGQDNHILAYLTLKGKLPTLGREMIAIVGKEVRVEIMGARVVGRVIIIVESTSKARKKEFAQMWIVLEGIFSGKGTSIPMACRATKSLLRIALSKVVNLDL